MLGANSITVGECTKINRTDTVSICTTDALILATTLVNPLSVSLQMFEIYSSLLIRVAVHRGTQSTFILAQRWCPYSQALKVGRGVDLVRLVVVLQGGLEWCALAVGAEGSHRFLLLLATGTCVVVHEAVALLRKLLSSPDSPGHYTQSTKDNGASNADNHTNHGVARLWRQARG